MPKLKWSPGTRVESTRGAKRGWRTGYVVGRVGTNLAVQWDGETRAIPYNNWMWPTPANSPLRHYRGEPRTWRIVMTAGLRPIR